ncbi:unnamed protein product [Rotaria magnacalcarata]|uniref:Uncharacterized protein n=3 Tax=Rotaria magnacalcarata TaxID=392030 RepID=A0A815SBJ4_9BILA|nr:unnamed protein product [Rotaria magnacalcarata]
MMEGKEHKNLETFSLVWLDPGVNNSKENINVQQQFRACISHLETFDKVDKCERFIRSEPINSRIILVASERLSPDLIPRIHQLSQVFSIYIYGVDKRKINTWTNTYSKVKAVLTDVNVLVSQICSDHVRRSPTKSEDLFEFNIFNASTSDERSTTVLNGQFLHSQLLIDCLLQKEYKLDTKESAILREFQANYSPDQSIWWYTRESFLYRQLNKALRTQNIDALFAFRFFIRDIHEQLEHHRCSSPIHIYRGQLMSTVELERLKNSAGQLISMNSFLSTTNDRLSALEFLYSSAKSDGLERVLFEIDADPQLADVKPFVNITSLSYFPSESEVLLMLGSILRLVGIDHDDHGVSIIRSTLCSNSDQDLQRVFEYMKVEYGDQEINAQSFGIVLGQMGNLDGAGKYFRRLLKEMPPNHVDIAGCYHNLGDILDKKGDYESSLESYQKSLEIMLQTRQPNDPEIGTSLNSIVAVHAKTGNYTQAEESFKKAFEIWKQAYGEDNPKVAMCLSNLAGIYQVNEKNIEALDCLQKALSIRQHHLPADHPDMADTHNNIGILYWSLDKADTALEHYNLSVKIKQKCLPANHPDIAMTLSNMSLIYEQKGEFNQALLHLQSAANIYRQTLNPSHPHMRQVERLMQRVSSKLK